ncbi:hypothetical protein GBA52_019262, partial [Prunus armeniaca]
MNAVKKSCPRDRRGLPTPEANAEIQAGEETGLRSLKLWNRKVPKIFGIGIGNSEEGGQGGEEGFTSL